MMADLVCSENVPLRKADGAAMHSGRAVTLARVAQRFQSFAADSSVSSLFGVGASGTVTLAIP
jgi:hypothetical protein